jgi:hypothetical protein
MRDVSEAGIGFWSDREISPGTTVFVRLHAPDGPDEWSPVKVMHCTPAAERFLIGAQHEQST